MKLSPAMEMGKALVDLAVTFHSPRSACNLHQLPEQSDPRACCHPFAEQGHMSDKSSAASAGIGFGTALAITISWSLHESILWAICHGVFSWLYVIYFAFTR
jgi:hypothetical protein